MILGDKVLSFLKLLNQLPDKDYLTSIIACETAPTMKEKKPSTLMTFTNNRRNLYSIWKAFKSEIIEELQLDFIELNEKQDSVRVLFYDRNLLNECIHKKRCRAFLDMVGYKESVTIEECLDKLKYRFENICPHEIGIFLGIPVEDVVGFIKHKGENSILCHYWKVYHNPDAALNLFKSFDKAKEDTRNEIRKKHICADRQLCFN